MLKSNLYIAIVLVISLLVSCQSKKSELIKVEVNNSGALRTIMSGDISSAISLDSLQNKEHLFALGAVENLKGEIQIFDGKANNSSVVNDSIKINDAYNLNASLLVYSEVKEWNTFKVGNNTTKPQLETKIFELAKANGIDTEAPFPFLIEGTITALDWHVINWKDGDMVHNHKKHKESGLNGTLKNREVVIIGFYSTKHKAVFTHHTTNIHMHFKTVDNILAGHVDDVIGNSIKIKLPKTK
ncbi:acetolactate decarboxylase [uncultured Psychroserpens sp.]|uniref:acetolactate decarboxylase n=1 Tax=uncultured Psychroserpens sp. TaxID=255436 RepID=UPI00260B4394|nr:acetolactate decarboxylase [uncultured Psychroserpens sp.]